MLFINSLVFALALVADIKIPPTLKEIVLLPEVIVNLFCSEFLPPFKVSFPELPYKVSEPKPPFIVLLLLFPVKVSFP